MRQMNSTTKIASNNDGKTHCVFPNMDTSILREQLFGTAPTVNNCVGRKNNCGCVICEGLREAEAGNSSIVGPNWVQDPKWRVR